MGGKDYWGLFLEEEILVRKVEGGFWGFFSQITKVERILRRFGGNLVWSSGNTGSFHTV